MPVELSAGALDLTSLVRPGDTVIWSQGPSEPQCLTEALVKQRHHIGRFSAFLGSCYSKTFEPGHSDCIDFVGLGAVGYTRKILEAGALQVIPCHLSELGSMIRRREFRIDVVLLQVSQREEDGAFSYGAVCSYLPDAVRAARTVVAEINDQAPWTGSFEGLDPKLISHCVRVSRPLFAVPSRESPAEDVAIAKNLAPLIEDGAILQVGIGTLPNAILAELRGHRDLGIHSGVIGDGVVKLIEAGVVTNASKTIDRGVSVTGGLFGTRMLNQFAHRNPTIRVDPVSYTHRPNVLASFKSFTAINSAIEIDLFGQINSETANGKYVGTIGGQTDFVRGTRVSERGRSILAMSARVSAQGQSRVVNALSSSFVTAARADTDTVVTEFGVAELRGQTVEERARRLIAIAHPDDRECLSRGWTAARVAGCRVESR
jgi:acyl-CoA hydrolase